ncbi:hypothetical protein ACWDX6_24075 [Streptomyces sp. NPDC003027]
MNARGALITTLASLMSANRQGRPETHWAEAERLVEEAIREATIRIIPDRQHIVDIYQRDMAGLRTWLTRPDATHRVNDRVCFEAVGHGGIWVRTNPYRYKAPEVAA